MRSGEQLRDGPEGACAADVRRIEASVARLRHRLPSLVPVPKVLINAMLRRRSALNGPCNAIDRSVTHDTHGDLFERACVESARRATASAKSADCSTSRVIPCSVFCANRR